MTIELPSEVLGLLCYYDWQIVGSSLIEGIYHGDIDVLVYDKDYSLENKLRANVWQPGGSMTGGGPFRSYKAEYSKSGVINIILVSDKEYYDKFAKASQVCVDNQVRDKAHRIAIHEQIRGEGPLWGPDLLEPRPVDWPLYYFGLEGAYVQAETTDSFTF